jgi:CTP synthase (UTP-ammonia lyase)
VVRLGIIGDYNQTSETHRATDACIALASARLRSNVRSEWLPTNSLPNTDLHTFDAYIVNTGVYENRDAVLKALRVLREKSIPTLATCGGFQHMIIEYVHNVLGLEHLGHAEFDPTTREHIITPLACSLRGLEGEISLLPDSIVGRLYERALTTEKFYCSFGLNPQHRQALSNSPLRIVGHDGEGQVRMTELPTHPFYIGTLFVPQARALRGESHPLIEGLIVNAARKNSI